MNSVNVIGTGSWGLALANLVAKVNKKTVIWGRNEDIITEINKHHSCKKYLPNVQLENTIKATSDLKLAIDAEVLLLVIPVQAMRSICLKLAELNLSKEKYLVLCAKGIEESSLLLVSEIVADILPEHKNIIILSGPNLAKEVALKKPSATTIACSDIKIAEKVAKLLAAPEFRPYLSNDIVGTQLCGAVKNVLAIACGIAKGRNLSENTSALLVTRGLVEISRLIMARGGNAKTVMGLCGIGDIVLTCSSFQSRNHLFGISIGKGKSLAAALLEQKGVVEGAYTTQAVHHLSKQLNIEMPICDAVYKILYARENIEKVIDGLLSREIKYEL